MRCLWLALQQRRTTTVAPGRPGGDMRWLAARRRSCSVRRRLAAWLARLLASCCAGWSLGWLLLVVRAGAAPARARSRRRSGGARLGPRAPLLLLGGCQ